MLAVIPVIFPQSIHGGGDLTPITLSFAWPILAYSCQLVVVLTCIFCGDIKSRSKVLWWSVPFVPCVVALVNKIKQLEKIGDIMKKWAVEFESGDYNERITISARKVEKIGCRSVSADGVEIGFIGNVVLVQRVL